MTTPPPRSRPRERADAAPHQARAIHEQTDLVPGQADTVPDQAALIPGQADTVPDQAALIPGQADTVPERLHEAALSTDSRHTVTGRVEYSHLFRGAHIDLPGMDDPDGRFPVEFSDGSRTTAEVLDGDTVAVSAYRTAAGARIPARVWEIAERSWHTDLLRLRMGPQHTA